MSETNVNILLHGVDVDLFSMSMNREENSPSPSSSELDLGGSNHDSFPTVLHRIVSDESSDDCIHWLPCGTHFVIFDKEKFSKKVIPIYFGSRGATKFTSFTRRLKRWKFTRISKGPQLGAYYHENFVKDKPDLLKKIVYPGAKAKPVASSPSKSNDKVKSSNKARRRVSTGSLSRPLIVGSRSTSTPTVDDFTSMTVVDPFDVAINSISAPMQDDLLEISDKLDISPMPIKKTFQMSPESPSLTKDFTNWLSDTAFGDNGMNSQLAHKLLSSPIEPAVRRSSKLPRRHSCIASIHSTNTSYNVPLNDVDATAIKNSEFSSVPTAHFPLPSTSTSSYNRGMTDDNSLPSTNSTQNWPAAVSKVMQEQMQQKLQEQMQQKLQQQMQQKLQQQTQQQFVGGSQSRPFLVEQRLQQMQQQQQQQKQQLTQTQLQHFVGGLSAHEGQITDLKQTQRPSQTESQSQSLSQRSSFLDELDDFLRGSKEREFNLDDFLNGSH